MRESRYSGGTGKKERKNIIAIEEGGGGAKWEEGSRGYELISACGSRSKSEVSYGVGGGGAVVDSFVGVVVAREYAIVNLKAGEASRGIIWAL